MTQKTEAKHALLQSESVSLFDPVCGSLKGHNYNTLLSYAEWFTLNEFDRVRVFTASDEAKTTEEATSFIPCIPWIYNFYLPRKNNALLPHSGIQQLAKSIPNKWRPARQAKTCVLMFAHLLAVQAITRAFKKVLATERNLVFLPGADIYSILALQKLQGFLSRLRNKPQIILRLMGVMENAGYFPGSHELAIKSLKYLAHREPNIHVTAETEKYAAYLEKLLRLRIPVTGIPHKKRDINDHSSKVKNLLQRSSARTIAILGSARADKGYFDILELSKNLRSCKSCPVQLVYQQMDNRQKEYNKSYEGKLAQCSNLVPLDPLLSGADYHHVVSHAEIVLLPYDTATYRYRGSSVLFDALAYRRPVLANSGTAYAHSILASGLGEVYYDPESFASRVDRLFTMNTTDRAEKMDRASAYYEKLTASLLALVKNPSGHENRVY